MMAQMFHDPSFSYRPPIEQDIPWFRSLYSGLTLEWLACALTVT